MTKEEAIIQLGNLKKHCSNELKTIVDIENNKKIADWYITEPRGFIIGFLTLDPIKCKAILEVVLKELEQNE